MSLYNLTNPVCYNEKVNYLKTFWLAAAIAVITSSIYYSSAVFAQTALPPQLTSPLFFGLRGNDVTALQQYLAQDKNLYPEGLITGYFGRLTEAAVKKFQEKHGIESIGIVGPKTRAKLNELRKNLTGATITPAPSAPEPTAVPTPAEPTSITPTAPAPSPKDLIKTGEGLVAPGRIFNVGPAYFWLTASNGGLGRGYLTADPEHPGNQIANITRLRFSSCENIEAKEYIGPTNICEFADPTKYTFTELKEAIRFYDKAASTSGSGSSVTYCYQGILLFKKDNIYGGIEPTDVISDHSLKYRYWYDESGGTNFASLCPTSGSPAAELALISDSLQTLIRLFNSFFK